MIKEIILNILLITVFAIVAVIKAGQRPIPYKKIIPAILLPIPVIMLTQIPYRFFPDNAFYLEDHTLIVTWYAISYAIVCLVNITACCFIYKAVSDSSDKLIHIWKKDFKLWNKVSIVMIVLGCVCCVLKYNIYKVYLSRFLTKLINNTFLSLLSSSDTVLLLMKQFDLAQIVIKILVIGSMMIPLFRKK